MNYRYNEKFDKKRFRLFELLQRVRRIQHIESILKILLGYILQNFA